MAMESLFHQNNKKKEILATNFLNKVINFGKKSVIKGLKI